MYNKKMGVQCNFGQNFGKPRINHHYTINHVMWKEQTHGEQNILNISAKVSYPHRSFLLIIHYIHIPCDTDCVHSHVEGMKSDISGFVAQVFLNEEPQLMPENVKLMHFQQFIHLEIMKSVPGFHILLFDVICIWHTPKIYVVPCKM